MKVSPQSVAENKGKSRGDRGVSRIPENEMAHVATEKEEEDRRRLRRVFAREMKRKLGLEGDQTPVVSK